MSIPRVHPDQISSRSDYSITTVIMCTTTKNVKKQASLKKRSGPYYKTGPEFFRDMLFLQGVR